MIKCKIYEENLLEINLKYKIIRNSRRINLKIYFCEIFKYSFFGYE